MMQKSRNLIITGANSGIGHGLATAYAGSNTHLLLIARDVERLEAVASVCRGKGAQVEVAAVDVTDAAIMAQTITAFDLTHPVDIVIANAGISSFGQHWNAQRAQQIFNVNVQGVLNTIHPLIDKMRERKRGHIVLMSSMASFISLPRAPAYASTKTAVRIYGEALYEWLKKDNVAVSVICPGFIKTPLTDKNPYDMPFIMSVDKAVAVIQKGLAKKKARIIFPGRMRFLTILLSWLPFRLAQHIAGQF